jgi:hypothetical protein
MGYLAIAERLDAGKPRCDRSDQSPAVSKMETEADYEAWICRGIERDLGLPRGSLELWEPITGRSSMVPLTAAPVEQRQQKSWDATEGGNADTCDRKK